MAKLKRIVVTGGSGKAGTATIRELLARDYETINLDWAVPQENLCPFMEVDLTDFGQTIDALSGFDAVVHMAAIPAPGRSPAEVTFRENILSTFNIFQAAQILGMKRVVWASSETTLGLPFEKVIPSEAPIDESHYPFPESTYSLSKVAGETIAEQFNRWTGTPHVGLRFSNIMLPDDYARFPKFQDDPHQRKWNLWGYVDARDVGQSCRLGLEAEISGSENFIIAAADTVMKMPNSDLLAAVFPSVRLKAGTGPNETLLSIEKAKNLLGYRPAHSWRDYV